MFLVIFFLQIYLFPLYQQYTSFLYLLLNSVFPCSKVPFSKSHLFPCCFIMGVTVSCRVIRSKYSFLWALFSYPKPAYWGITVVLIYWYVFYVGYMCSFFQKIVLIHKLLFQLITFSYGSKINSSNFVQIIKPL